MTIWCKVKLVKEDIKTLLSQSHHIKIIIKTKNHHQYNTIIINTTKSPSSSSYDGSPSLVWSWYQNPIKATPCGGVKAFHCNAPVMMMKTTMMMMTMTMMMMMKNVIAAKWWERCTYLNGNGSSKSVKCQSFKALVEFEEISLFREDLFNFLLTLMAKIN